MTHESLFPLQQSSSVKPVLVSSPVLMYKISEPVVERKEVDIAPNDGLLRGHLKNSDTEKSGYFSWALSRWVDELIKLINSYQSLFSDTPSQTHLYCCLMLESLSPSSSVFIACQMRRGDSWRLKYSTC